MNQSINRVYLERLIRHLKIRENFRVYLELAHLAFLTTLVVLVFILYSPLRILADTFGHF